MSGKMNGPLHFVADYSGETLCGKSASHTRSTRNLFNWDSTVIAGGRRCEECRPTVERIRSERKADASP